MKVGGENSLHRCGQIDEVRRRCPVENTEKAHHLQSPLHSRTSSFQVVKNDQVRSKILSEKDRFPFALLKAAQASWRSRTDWMDP